jgi:DNA-binding transcriptional MerR regulator
VKTSELAARFSVHPNTIRLYEAWGYLPAIPRDASGRRVFTERHAEQMGLARRTLHGAPRSGPQFREAYQALVWLACAGQPQSAVTQAHKQLATVRHARERAQHAREFLGGALPEPIARQAQRPLLIRQAASFVDETVPVLRRWESSGVISVPRNPSNSYRIYGPNELGWLLILRSLRLAGHSMASCRKLIGQHHGEKSPREARSRSHKALDDALLGCITLFNDHERHTNEVLEQLRHMETLV